MMKAGRIRPQGSLFRLNISYLREDTFGKYSILGKDVKRQIGISPKLDTLKNTILQLLMKHQRHRGLTNYTIAWQTHQSTGTAHLDILLKYDHPVKKTLSTFKYLLPDCPQDLHHFSEIQGNKPQVFITPYSMTNLNQAILQYGIKEDPAPLNNFTHDQSERYLVLAAIKKDPFDYFQKIMLKDPHNFNLSCYVRQHNLGKVVPGWSAIKAKLRDMQSAECALLERRKPGLRLIDRPLIQSRLSPAELQTFDKYPCFQIIVNHLNQIPKYGPQRPHKTLNLFIHGPRGIGKTSFINQGPVNLADFVPHYDINLQNKYLNSYYNKIYGFISWNEFKYTDFSPTWVLKLLQGLPLQIPIRYASNIKRDNPLIIATSNFSLEYHIRRRFKGEQLLIDTAMSNLIDQRITQVHVPVEMHFMQKLLLPAEPFTKAFD